MKTPPAALGSLTVTALAALGLPALQAQTLYSDNFDANTSALWTISTSDAGADTFATFAYDYSADGIPAAPNSAGTTRGLRFTANNAAPNVAAGLSASPNGQLFTGDYELRFDLWINANGPFPAGGTGSTQFASAGVGLGAPALVWSGGAPAGVPWFGVSGEGGSVQDYRAYLGGTQFGATSGVYAAGTTGEPRDAGNAFYTALFPGQQPPPLQQAAGTNQTGAVQNGAIGFGWRDVAVRKEGPSITWSIDGNLIATINTATNVVQTDGTVAVGYFDPFNSVTDAPQFSFGVVDNVRVNQVPEPGLFALGAVGAGVLLLRRRRG
ncbi:MAG: hypothetical protein ACKVYV_14610 [Limisphaerales bacterium]